MSDRFSEQMLQAGDSNLDPIAGAKLNFYITSTSTRKDTYSDSDKTTPNANPVVADAAGRFGDIFMDTDVAYKVVYTDASDVTIQTFDPFSPVRADQVIETPVVSKSANFTILTTQKGSLFEVDASSASVSATLPTAASAGNNFEATVKKIDSSANAVTVDGDGSETIDGATTQTLSNQYDAITVVSDGTEWHVKSENDASESAPLPPSYIDGFVVTNNSTDSDHDLDTTAGTCRDSADGTNITLPSDLIKRIDASWVAGTNQGGLSSSLTLAADTDYYMHAIVVGGSADVGIDTSATAANLVTDHSATAYREINKIRTDSSANIINDQFSQVILGGREYTFAEQATTSGTEFDFQPIASDAKRITVLFEGVSLDGTDNIIVQIGDSGGFQTTGYVSTSVRISTSGNTGNSTSGFIFGMASAGQTASAHMVLIHMGGNTWISSHAGKINTTNSVVGGGNKDLSDTLDRIRITRTGTDAFDAGAVNILVE